MLLKRIVLAVGFLYSCLTFAQNPILNQAYREFDLLNYKEAAKLFEQLGQSQTFLSDDQKIQVLQKAAFSYKELKQFNQAEEKYSELLKLKPELNGEDARIYLFFAQTLASNGKHKEADIQYEHYRQSGLGGLGNGATAKILSEATISNKNAERYQVQSLSFNTNGPEFSPMYYKNGLVYVANERGGGKKFLDLFYSTNPSSLLNKGANNQEQDGFSRLGADSYTQPTSNDSKTLGHFGGNFVNAGLGYEERPLSQSDIFSQTLNTKYHEGPATFSKDYQQVIFTRNNYNEGEYRKSSDGVNKLKLYVANFVNGAWQEAQELPFNSDEFSSGHPALSPDSKLLYFASDRPGGLGGTDIYFSRLEGGVWQTPVNLGKELNSKGDEMFPFIDEKGNLYFSTNGRGGLGEADIFFVPMNQKTGLPMGKPQNLGSPINSEFDDFGIITDAERQSGYFSTNRKSAGDNDDIFSFVRSGSLFECRELIVSVYDEEGKKPLAKASIEYGVGEGKNKKTKKVNANENGLIKLCLEANNDFVFLIQNENYVGNKIGFSTKDWKDDSPTRIDIPLKRILVVEAPQPVAVILPSPPPPNLIYESNTNPNVTVYRGYITAGEDQQAIAGVLVTITNECDGNMQQVKTGNDGSYEFQQEEGCDYIIEASKENFGKKAERIVKTVERKPSSTRNQEPRYRAGDVILVDNIFYDSGEWKLKKDAKRELDKIVATLQRNNSMVIELRSHTDSRGNAEQNRQLSQKRAAAAADYVASRGIKRNRLIAKGYGESMPINECVDGVQCTEAEYQRNRRTEFKILSLIL